MASGTPLTETMLLLPLYGRLCSTRILAYRTDKVRLCRYFVAFFGTLSNLVMLIRALFANTPQLGSPQPARRKEAMSIFTTQNVSVATEHSISFELMVSEKRIRISSGEGLGLGPISH